MAAPGRNAGEILLPLRLPIDLALTVASHGWAHLAPWRWEPEAGTLSRRERIGAGLGTIAVAQRDPAAIAIRYDDFDTPTLIRGGDRPPRAPLAVGRLGLRRKRSPHSARTGALIGRGGGRLLRCSSFYEDFVKTVLTINTAWSSTCRMAAALVAEPGGGAFPGPEAVLDYGEVRLRERAKLGFRAPTVISATRRMLEDGAIDRSGEGRPDYEYLIGLYGIGPYAAAHCRLVAARFQPHPGQFGGDRLFARAPRQRSRRFCRQPRRLGRLSRARLPARPVARKARTPPPDLSRCTDPHARIAAAWRAVVTSSGPLLPVGSRAQQSGLPLR